MCGGIARDGDEFEIAGVWANLTGKVVGGRVLGELKNEHVFVFKHLFALIQRENLVIWNTRCEATHLN